LDYSATTYFEKYLRDFKGGSYVKSAYQKMAWLELIHGNLSEYKRLIAFCKTEGNDNLGSDDHAEKEGKKGKIPDVSLLKARLLYDGGYYNRSLAVLSEINRENFDRSERTEFYYRIGRNYQGLKSYNEALNYFKRAIASGNDLKAYFAGNAALQAGLIYENLNEPDSAAYYYNTCLDLDFKTYKKSLDVKAKAALDRVKTKKGAR
ncbi:MAG: hypothetical protein MI702_00430, partial [Chlorobiales bacterium]|nr:hypothetical protein [Chlorobiales bacterium]